jgi:uncharacterized protein (DUF697 family)/tellurite resistance protein
MNIPHLNGEQDAQALVKICVFAAFADGEKSEAERESIRSIAEDLGISDPAAAVRDVLMRRTSLSDACAALQTRDERLLAYEFAFGICEAGGEITSAEKEFLQELRTALELNTTEEATLREEVDSVALVPVTSREEASAPTEQPPDNSGMILKYAILNGALELLPDTIATMAIIPMQLKMVYRIGKSHGVELDRSHIKEFLATAGLGMGSQVVEGFARGVMRSLGKKFAGKLGGRIASQSTGSALTFASTYAIGQLAEHYYASGRKIDPAALRGEFDSLRNRAQELHGKYLPQIQEQARSLNPTSILALLRQ